jgi:hypothetical protein
LLHVVNIYVFMWGLPAAIYKAVNPQGMCLFVQLIVCV